MILHNESHTDHVPAAVLGWVLHHFEDRTQFFVETRELPEGLPPVDCGLHGPLMGDAVVEEAEVTYGARGGRLWSSRLVDRPARKTRQITVIGGPYENHSCVLYTTFGGPPTPKEPNDPTLDPTKQEESQKFWSEHALSL